MTRIYKADLHVHSNHSNKSSIWALRKINCPESYTTPLFIYKTAIKRGMDYVTITDHNSINGAIEIAHLPNTFISTEATAYFPEDGCKIHVVVLDITEKIFGNIMYLRKNIYDLVAYLQEEDITHFLAHPLYELNEKLSVGTIEKLLLLFESFEVRNGSRARRYNQLMENILSSLTKEKIGLLANKHNMPPYGDTPWIKGMTGGSDDHSGFFIGRAYTASKSGEGMKDFIKSVKGKGTWAGGEDGDPLSLAHSIYGIGYRFFKERFEAKEIKSFPFINALMNRVFDTDHEEFSLYEKINLFIRKNIPEIYDSYDGKTFGEIIDIEAKRLLNDAKLLTAISTADINRKIFAVTSHLANRLIYIYTSRLAEMLTSMSIMNMANSLTTIGLVHFLTFPYYLAFHHQHTSKKLIKELETRFELANSPKITDKIALFTDTLHEINGVAITIKRLIETAKKQGIKLVVITSSDEETGFKDGIMNFKSIGDFTIPEYPDLKMHFPPILDVIDYFEKEGFTRIHASTPGTLGLLSLFIAKLMDIPISGTYHTDIPQYAKSLTNDAVMENAAWNYMIWFYNLMDEVMVPSSSTRRHLIERGLMEEKVKPLPRWVDTEAFSPAKRDASIWHRYKLNGTVKFLYVGRVSKEKNLGLLADAFIEIIKLGFNCNLIIVGDGHYRQELEQILKDYPALFTGFLSGNELSGIYASADVFVFPSTTDTFGNVVLEAQASGLPAIVSDEGGPGELMVHGETGLIMKADNKSALIDAMIFFLSDSSRISAMGKKARLFTVNNGINADEAYSTILRSNLILNSSQNMVLDK